MDEAILVGSVWVTLCVSVRMDMLVCVNCFFKVAVVMGEGASFLRSRSAVDWRRRW